LRAERLPLRPALGEDYVVGREDRGMDRPLPLCGREDRGMDPATAGQGRALELGTAAPVTPLLFKSLQFLLAA